MLRNFLTWINRHFNLKDDADEATALKEVINERRAELWFHYVVQ